MADIHKLDGGVLDASKLGRNERVAQILETLTADNDAGKLTALAAISLNHAQTYNTFWAYPDDAAKYPWLWIVVGAIEVLKAEMMAAARDG